MLKPDSLRRALTDAVTVLKTNPDMLRIFVVRIFMKGDHSITSIEIG